MLYLGLPWTWIVSIEERFLGHRKWTDFICFQVEMIKLVVDLNTVFIRRNLSFSYNIAAVVFTFWADILSMYLFMNSLIDRCLLNNRTVPRCDTYRLKPEKKIDDHLGTWSTKERRWFLGLSLSHHTVKYTILILRSDSVDLRRHLVLFSCSEKEIVDRKKQYS